MSEADTLFEMVEELISLIALKMVQDGVWSWRFEANNLIRENVRDYGIEIERDWENDAVIIHLRTVEQINNR